MPLANPEKWMREALLEARKAEVEAEVPVGAVVVFKGEIIGRGHNEVEARASASAHAEMLALEQASKYLGNWRLVDTSLFVSLEPCSMCIGAMILARVSELYFGCYDPRQGAVGSVFDISNHPGLPHSLEVYPEVLAEDSKAMLQGFFSEKRGG